MHLAPSLLGRSASGEGHRSARGRAGMGAQQHATSSAGSAPAGSQRGRKDPECRPETMPTIRI